MTTAIFDTMNNMTPDQLKAAYNEINAISGDLFRRGQIRANELLDALLDTIDDQLGYSLYEAEQAAEYEEKMANLYC